MGSWLDKITHLLWLILVQWFWGKKLKVVNKFKLLPYCVALTLIKLEFSSYKNDLCKVWLKMACGSEGDFWMTSIIINKNQQFWYTLPWSSLPITIGHLRECNLNANVKSFYVIWKKINQPTFYNILLQQIEPCDSQWQHNVV